MTAQGISFAEANALMDAARRVGRKPKVRTFQKNSGKQHCGRAFLLEVVNKTTARIQPFRHGGKIETVPLNELRLWKGGNEHISIEEIRKMSGTSTAAVPAKGTHTEQARFVVFSKKAQGVWGGERARWTQDFNRAVRWTQSEHNSAKGIEYKLKGIPNSDDAILLKDTIAFGALTELLEELTAPPTQVQQAPTVPQNVAAIPQKLELDGEPQLPKKVLPSDSFIDLDALFNDNEELLRKAESERKAVGLEYKNALEALEALKRKFELLDRNVVGLGGHSVLKGAAPQAPKAEGKRVFLRAKIRNILLTSSRLDNASIHARLLAEVPDVTTIRVSSALSAMRADDLAERDDNGGWALTTKGRTAEMMGGSRSGANGIR